MWLSDLCGRTVRRPKNENLYEFEQVILSPTGCSLGSIFRELHIFSFTNVYSFLLYLSQQSSQWINSLYFTLLRQVDVGLSSRVFQRANLRPLACWYFGFETHRGPWKSVCCEWCEFSGRSICDFLKNPTDWGTSLCVIYKPREWGGHGPLGGCCIKKKTNRPAAYIWRFCWVECRHASRNDGDTFWEMRL